MGENGDPDMVAKKKLATDESQLEAFRKAAREAGCEPDEKRFQDALRTIAKAKPSEGEKRRPDRQGKDKKA
jgi:hypothetical protein